MISDRNRKENFLAVDGEDLLSRIHSLPVTTWQHRDEQDRTVRHTGPWRRTGTARSASARRPPPST